MFNRLPGLMKRSLVREYIVALAICGATTDRLAFSAEAAPKNKQPATNILAISANSDAGIPNESRLAGPSLSATPSWSEALRAVLLTAIPDKYEDRRNWDKTREVFDGLNVKQRGFNLRVAERKKRVNHGAWHKYQVQLLDPDHHLHFKLDNIRPATNRGFRFNIKLACRLNCRGDFERWVLGVKGLNFTIISEADVQIVADCQLAIRTETKPKSLIPDLVFEPQLTDLKINLTGLEVRRIGEIRGDIAEGIGDGSRSFIEALLHSQEGPTLKKANEALQKKSGQLRLPMSRFW